MKYTLLLSLFLIFVPTIHAMEAVLNNKEIVTYNLAPLLDRQDRAALKLTNNFLCNTIVPQHVLNEKYEVAYLTNSTKEIDELRKKGALHLHEEVYKLFFNNKPKLIIKIVPRNQNAIRSIFLYGIQEDNIQFMQWLLDTKKPHHSSSLLDKSLAESKDCKHAEITQLLENYITTEQYKERIDITKTIILPNEVDENTGYVWNNTKLNKKASQNKCIIS